MRLHEIAIAGSFLSGQGDQDSFNTVKGIFALERVNVDLYNHGSKLLVGNIPASKVYQWISDRSMKGEFLDYIESALEFGTYRHINLKLANYPEVSYAEVSARPYYDKIPNEIN